LQKHPLFIKNAAFSYLTAIGFFDIILLLVPRSCFFLWECSKGVVSMNGKLLMFAALALSAVVFSGCMGGSEASSVVTDLKTDYLPSPLNIGAKPQFSWCIESKEKGVAQSSYRIRVREGSEDGVLVWDSKEVSSGLSVAIPYGGSGLKPATKYVWTVDAKGLDGKPFKPASGCFSTGFVAKDFWNSSVWIAPKTEMNGMDTAAFRKIVRPAKDVKEAWWAVTGLGVFEAYVNGEPVSRKTPCGKIVRDFLKPGFTHVGKCRHSFTYDVTHLFKTGAKSENVLSAFVSQGWWRDQITGKFGKESAFRAQLVLKYEDGTQETVGTDTTWLSKYAGPVVKASIFDGEKYDARINADWMKGGELDGSWSASKVNTEFKGEIRNFTGTPIRLREDLALSPATVKVMKGVKGETKDAFGVALVARECKPDETIELSPGEELVVDFAQNAAAVDSFTVEGQAGTILKIRHCEMLNEGNGLKSRGNDGPEGLPYVPISAARRRQSPTFSRTESSPTIPTSRSSATVTSASRRPRKSRSTRCVRFPSLRSPARKLKRDISKRTILS
jgi:hypothetical protein